MPIVIKWDSGMEYLAIDLDNLDANEVGEITETREWWPRTGNVYWTVQCQLEEIDGGHQVRVTYEEANQNDENIQRRIGQDGPRGWFGTSTIIVKRDPQTNRAGTEGPCDWEDVYPEWNGRSHWRIVGRPRLRVTREQWEREQGFGTPGGDGQGCSLGYRLGGRERFGAANPRRCAATCHGQ